MHGASYFLVDMAFGKFQKLVTIARKENIVMPVDAGIQVGPDRAKDAKAGFPLAREGPK
jgi:hypothetical protein